MRDVGAAEADRPGGRLVETQHHAADRGLAAAGFADQPERLARHHVQRNVVDRLHRRGLGRQEPGARRLHGEIFLQMIDHQQRFAVLLRALRVGRGDARP
jgi:hypothetical protein